jgi:hypothetical protein
LFLEKKVSFDVSNIFNCVNILQKEILPNLNTDISIFVTKTHYAFLPKNVYLFEEYGLPRMISKKIHLSGLINIEDNDMDLHSKYSIKSSSPLLQKFYLPIAFIA